MEASNLTVTIENLNILLKKQTQKVNIVSINKLDFTYNSKYKFEFLKFQIF